MRIAALAFGVLAGLVASLILALGGLDATTAIFGGGERQVSLIRFGLFVLANIGVFGAALTLAAPLAAAIVLALGAIGWIAAALLLRHGPDFVLITPPALLLIAAAIALVAQLRRPRAAAREFAREFEEDAPPVPVREPARRPAIVEEPAAEDFKSLPSVPVTAGYFSSAAAAPSSVRAEPPRPPDPNLRGLDERDQIRSPLADNWEPRKKKPPPRQEPMFREAPEDEDDDDQPTFFARFASAVSSVLSFGLYAALVGAAFLVFWNLRTGEAGTPIAAKAGSPVLSAAPPAAAATSSSAAAQPSSSEQRLAPLLASSAEPPPAPSSEPSTAEAAPAQENGLNPGLSLMTSPTLGGVVVAPDPFASSEAQDRLAPQSGLAVADTSPEPAASSEPPAPTAEFPSDATVAGSSAAPLPFTMTPSMAAARAQPSPGPSAAAPRNDTTTGL